MSDDALRQACEKLCEKWFDTGARASWCPKMVDELLAFAKQQRAAGLWEVHTHMGETFDNAKDRDAVFYEVLIGELDWCEARAKELEAT